MSEDQRTMFYQSTIRGRTEEETKRATVYYGATYKIPRDIFATDEQIEVEKQMLEKLNEWIETDIDEDEGRFPQDGIIERYEVYEIGTGDIWVMYRVPHQAIDLAEPTPTFADEAMDEAPDLSPEMKEVISGYIATSKLKGKSAGHTYARKLVRLARQLLRKHGISRHRLDGPDDTGNGKYLQ